jgi:hypothetical protein
MRRERTIVTAAALLALAGCGFGPGGATTGGGAGLPEVRAMATDVKRLPPGRGPTGVVVRSFAADPGGDLVEVAGANCVFTADVYRAEVVTPARVVIPDLGADAPEVRADCRLGADLAGAVIAEPQFRWDSTGGSQAERVFWRGGQWWGGPQGGPMRYPDLAVPLRPVVQGPTVNR